VTAPTCLSSRQALDRRRAELREACQRRAALEAEAATMDLTLRALLAVRRAQEAGLTPELDRLHHQVEDLLGRARAAMYRTDKIRTAVDQLGTQGHGDLAETTPALTRAFATEASSRRRLQGLLAEQLPQAMHGGTVNAAGSEVADGQG
jgi:hypothetical protein